MKLFRLLVVNITHVSFVDDGMVISISTGFGESLGRIYFVHISEHLITAPAWNVPLIVINSRSTDSQCAIAAT